jgi:hypothetical protein
MSGYLVKQGGNRKNWKKRFCVLTSDSISYYGKKKVPFQPIPRFHSFLFLFLLIHFCVGPHADRCDSVGRDSGDCTRESDITRPLLCAAYQASFLIS